ncbi:magnesium transporter [Blastococcus sp. TF02-09]|uniref:magnesium transporter n=1 Tax=Blastococcus sp. TF02-09 TaxID=2250576 RepID=UPI000DEAAE1C|nr:magnesium transporter [Blastococcus sp. TF02-9]RBY79412.1 magnesium transporter [Blastococcus sp. TF02-9]
MNGTSTTLRSAVLERDQEAAGRWVRARIGPRDRAEQLHSLSPTETAALTDTVDDGTLAALIRSLRARDAAHLLVHLNPTKAGRVLAALPPDRATDLLQAVGTEKLPGVLVAMPPARAAELEGLTRWPPNSAGGRMTPAFVAVTADVKADDAIAGLRRVAAEAETISYVYVINEDSQLRGVLSLRNLVLSDSHTPVAKLMDADVITVAPLTDQEEAARLLTEHDLIALPVVDTGRLVGIITADDVADIIEEETTKDFSRLGGSQPLEVPYLQASPIQLWRKRVLWLLALFVAEAYTGTVLRHFEADLEAVVALAFFIPLLIGTGGNVGSQIVTTLVRAMAVDDVRLSDVGRVIRKETATGAMLGVVLAAVAFVRALLLDVGYDLAIVVTLTIVAIVLWASLVGAILPPVLRRLRIDPAVVSAPFITTLVDGTGLLIYFGIARLML